jgi:hypothetical protein
MLLGLPHQGKSLKHFGQLNWSSLGKIVASGGNVRKRNLKFQKEVFI